MEGHFGFGSGGGRLAQQHGEPSQRIGELAAEDLVDRRKIVCPARRHFTVGTSEKSGSLCRAEDERVYSSRHLGAGLAGPEAARTPLQGAHSTADPVATDE